MHDRARMYATTHKLGYAKPHAQLQVISRAPLTLASAQVLQPFLCRPCEPEFPSLASTPGLPVEPLPTRTTLARTSCFSACHTNITGMSTLIWTLRRSRSVFFDCDTEPTTITYPSMSSTPSTWTKHQITSLSRTHGAQNLPHIRSESIAENCRFAQIYMPFFRALPLVAISG